MKNIALFAYDFPHRKTHDFILDLVAGGIRNIVVLAAGRKKLNHQDSRSYFDASLQACPPLLASDLCDRLTIPFYRVEHEDVARIGEFIDGHECEIAIISGARIIREEVIALFPGGVINFHPGKIPETSGLDSFFYTLKNNVSAGVTTHFIDRRVDAGAEIHFDEAFVSPASTPETILENVYQLQRVALRRVIAMLSAGEIPSTPIHRPVKNLPMTPEQKIEAISHFANWRASRFIEQEHRKLMRASEAGSILVVKQILSDLPQLLHHKNEKGWTPLIVAAYNNHFDVVELLLQRGADPNDCGKKGTTALMYAKTRLLHDAHSSYELLDLLVKSGADVARTDCFGRAVLDYVADSGDRRMTEYFKQKLGAAHGVH